MAWIEAHDTLREHPKLYHLANALQITRETAVGHLMFFWWWTLTYAPTGRLEAFTVHQLETAAGWHGPPGAFIDAMVASRLLDVAEPCTGLAKPTCDMAENKSLCVHDWWDFCGELVKQRLRRMKAKRRTMRHVLPSMSHKTPATVPNRTVPNRTVPNHQERVARFEVFYAAYPKKKARSRALKAWLKLSPSEHLTATILAAVSAATTSEEWRKDKGQWIPHPATWLNDRRWEDQLGDATKPAALAALEAKLLHGPG